MGLKVTERIISMQHMKLVLLHYVLEYWSWSDGQISTMKTLQGSPLNCQTLTHAIL